MSGMVHRTLEMSTLNAAGRSLGIQGELACSYKKLRSILDATNDIHTKSWAQKTCQKLSSGQIDVRHLTWIKYWKESWPFCL